MYPRDTNVFVTLVPILAPIIMGTAPDTLIVPADTRPTIIDVVTLELWNNTVVTYLP